MIAAPGLLGAALSCQEAVIKREGDMAGAAGPAHTQQALLFVRTRVLHTSYRDQHSNEHKADNAAKHGF